MTINSPKFFGRVYFKGISTGDFSEALAALLGRDAPAPSPSAIVRLKGGWIEEHDAWQKRDLSGNAWVSCGIRQRARLDLVTELGDLGGQAPGFDLGGTAIEVDQQKSDRQEWPVWWGWFHPQSIYHILKDGTLYEDLGPPRT